MRTKLTLLAAGVTTAIMMSASPAAALPRISITDLRGSVNIQLPLPCGDPVNQKTDIQQGLMDITPHITGGTAQFDLTRLDMFLTPFDVTRDCGGGIAGSVHFRQISVQLAGAVSFTGDEIGSRESEVFRFIIPKEQFLIYESVMDDAPGHSLEGSPETAYQRPSQDVFGVIDLRRKVVELHVVLTTQLRFQAGCVRGKCAINQIETATQTSDVSGAQSCPGPRSAPVQSPTVDNVLPTVSCTLDNRQENTFLVVATDDDCIPPTIRLGSYLLSNGEEIQLLPSKTPGVQLVESKRTGGFRRFLVGPGPVVVTATDAAGNMGRAICR